MSGRCRFRGGPSLAPVYFRSRPEQLDADGRVFAAHLLAEHSLRGADDGNRSATMIRIRGVIMSKLTTQKSSRAGQFQAKRSSSEELAIFRSVVTSLKKRPEELRNVVVKAGITTASGNLKKAYKS